jgi:hypothetical protein
MLQIVNLFMGLAKVFRFTKSKQHKVWLFTVDPTKCASRWRHSIRLSESNKSSDRMTRYSTLLECVVPTHALVYSNRSTVT